MFQHEVLAGWLFNIRKPSVCPLYFKHISYFYFKAGKGRVCTNEFLGTGDSWVICIYIAENFVLILWGKLGNKLESVLFYKGTEESWSNYLSFYLAQQERQTMS